MELVYDDTELLHDRTTVDLFLAFSKLLTKKKEEFRQKDVYKRQDHRFCCEHVLEKFWHGLYLEYYLCLPLCRIDSLG